MKKENKKLLDLYKGFEGEDGYFFAAADKANDFHYFIKSWEGYVCDIFYKEPHMMNGQWRGFTKLFQEFIQDDIDYGLDNFYKVTNKQELFDDINWYKKNRTYNKEAQLLLDSLIELIQCAIDNGYDILIAKDWDS